MRVRKVRVRSESGLSQVNLKTLTKRTWTISISQVWSGVVSVEVQGGLQLRKSKLKSHFKSFDTNLM